MCHAHFFTNLALFIIASYIHSFFLSLRLTAPFTSTALFALAASPNYSPSLNAPSASRGRAPPSLNTSPPCRAPPSPLLLLLCPASSSCSCWICRPISASRTNGKKCGQFKRAAAGRIYHENPIKSGQRSVWGGERPPDANKAGGSCRRKCFQSLKHPVHTIKGTQIWLRFRELSRRIGWAESGEYPGNPFAHKTILRNWGGGDTQISATRVLQTFPKMAWHSQ